MFVIVFVDMELEVILNGGQVQEGRSGSLPQAHKLNTKGVFNRRLTMQKVYRMRNDSEI